ncbi:MAG: glutamate formimidoyltransferase [Bacteroidetes bacterium]|nr:glutamate formimidoyltransferase [Bacteroidota bacterium]
MKTPIIECVPNFSEGKNQKTIDAIAESIAKVPNVALLNVESDPDYNRTVVTFAGSPEAVLTAALDATRVAVERIDMSKHHGEHPRLGAVDVVPFVPLLHATIDDCITLAKRYGKDVAQEHNIPVYLYEYAASAPHRKDLASIRKGEYEHLSEKLADPQWYPDFGLPIVNKKSGATVTGARTILIAFNVTLNTPSIRIAQEIASTIRERGKPLKDTYGNIQTKSDGTVIMIPGTLKAVKAIGVYLQHLHCTQVSMNLVDYERTPLHRAYEEVKKFAELFNVEVLGSEIVGLVPLRALLQAGAYYTNNQPFPDTVLIEQAIASLGLNKIRPFNPEKKIIEYQLVNVPR